MSTNSIYTAPQGADGAQGIQGIQGTQGVQGPPGNDGNDAAADHDRQIANETSNISTTSNVWSTIPGMTLTTKNLGGTGNYVCRFSCEWNCSGTIKKVGIRMLVGGVAKVEKQYVTPDKVTQTDEHTDGNLIWNEAGVANGTVVEVQWRETEGTTFNMRGRTLIIDGILDTNII